MSRHTLRRAALALLLAVVVIALFWFSTVLAALLVLGLVGAVLLTAEVTFLSRFGRNPSDYTRKRRSGPWEGPR